MTITRESPICPTCQGHGAVIGRGLAGPCGTCGGVGRVEAPEPEKKDAQSTEAP